MYGKVQQPKKCEENKKATRHSEQLRRMILRHTFDPVLDTHFRSLPLMHLHD